VALPFVADFTPALNEVNVLVTLPKYEESVVIYRVIPPS
jgi:hypothetical protein